MACCGVTSALQARTPAVVRPRGCIGFVTHPRFQVGVGVMGPMYSYQPPLFFSPYAICGTISWPGGGNIRHVWMFPP